MAEPNDPFAEFAVAPQQPQPAPEDDPFAAFVAPAAAPEPAQPEQSWLGKAADYAFGYDGSLTRQLGVKAINTVGEWAGAEKPVIDAPTPLVDTAQTYLEGRGQGAAFNMRAPVAAAEAVSPYIAAKLRGEDTTFGQQYDAASKAIQQRADEHPIASVGGQITGAVAGSMATGGVAGVAGRALPAVAASVAKFVASSGALMKGVAAIALGAGEGAASGALQGAAHEVDQAIERGDWSNLGEKLYAGTKEGAKLGGLIGGALPAAAGVVKIGLKGLGKVAGGAEESAYKAVVGRTSKGAIKQAERQGGPAAVGRTLLDEGIPLAGSAETIQSALASKLDDVGAELGAKAAQADALAGGQGLSRAGLWEAIERDVIKPLDDSPINKDVARSLRRQLGDLQEHLVPSTEARIVAGNPRTVSVAAEGAVSPTVAGNPRTISRAADEALDPFTMGRPVENKVEQVLQAPSGGTKLDVSDPFTMGKTPMAEVTRDAVLAPSPARNVLDVADPFLMGSPVRGTPPNISFEEVRQLRAQLDDRLYKESASQSPSTSNPVLEGMREARRAIEDYWLSSAERAAKKAGVEGYAAEIGDLKRRYAHLALAKKQADDAVQTRLANRSTSLSDYIAGGALGSGLTSAGTAVGGGLVGLAGGAAMSQAHKLLREHGRGIAAIAIDKIQKGVNAAARQGIPAAAAKVVDVAARRTAVESELKRLDSEQDDTGPLSALERNVGPELAQAYAATMQRRDDFLRSKLPPAPAPTVFGAKPARVLPDETVDELSRYLDAVNDPTAALGRVAAGKHTAEDVESLQAVYPGMWSEFRDKAVDALASRKEPLDYDTQVRVASTLGLPLVGELDPVAQSFWQTQGPMAPQAQQSAPPARPVSSMSIDSNATKSRADRIG